MDVDMAATVEHKHVIITVRKAHQLHLHVRLEGKVKKVQSMRTERMKYK